MKQGRRLYRRSLGTPKFLTLQHISSRLLGLEWQLAILVGFCIMCSSGSWECDSCWDQCGRPGNESGGCWDRSGPEGSSRQQSKRCWSQPANSEGCGHGYARGQWSSRRQQATWGHWGGQQTSESHETGPVSRHSTKRPHTKEGTRQDVALQHHAYVRPHEEWIQIAEPIGKTCTSVQLMWELRRFYYMLYSPSSHLSQFLQKRHASVLHIARLLCPREEALIVPSQPDGEPFIMASTIWVLTFIFKSTLRNGQKLEWRARLSQEHVLALCLSRPHMDKC